MTSLGRCYWSYWRCYESTKPEAGRDPSSWAVEKGFDMAVSYAVGGASGGS